MSGDLVRPSGVQPCRKCFWGCGGRLEDIGDHHDEVIALRAEVAAMRELLGEAREMADFEGADEFAARIDAALGKGKEAP